MSDTPTTDKRTAKADAAAEKARAKAERPIWKKKRFILPVALLAVIVAVSLGGDDDDVPLAGEDAQADEPTEAATENGSDEADDVDAGNSIGDTVSMGDLGHTLHGARFADGDDIIVPDDGERWLVLDIEIDNNGDDSETVSSVMMWRLNDADNRSRDLTFSNDEQGSLDGELGAGRSMRGEIAYSVGDDQDTWELVFEPNLFGFGQAIYSVDVDDVD